MKLNIKILGIFFLLFFVVIGGGSYQPEQKIEITFVYQNKTWFWSDDELLNKVKNFEHWSQAQKNGRMGNVEERIELTKKINKLGFSLQESFEYVFYGINNKIDAICEHVNKQAVDATMKFTPNSVNVFKFTNEQIGYKVNKDKLYKQILEQLKTSNIITVEVEPEILQPKVTVDELKPLSNKLSSFKTSFASSSESRKHNVRKSLSCFNGMVLEPYQEYSFNTITKRRTVENGYMPAKIIVNEEYVEGVGGGVCQTSTTMYNALLLAGVEILEVHPHSLQSSYVLAGFDAMVNYGSSDLRWKNNTNSPIFIKTYTTNSDVCVEIYGKKSTDYELKRVNKLVKTIKAPAEKVIIDTNGDYANKVYYEDESFYKQYGKDGSVYKSYLEYWQNGKMIDKKQIRTQTYKPVQAVKIVGYHKREPEIIETPIIEKEELNNFKPDATQPKQSKTNIKKGNDLTKRMLNW